MGERKAEENPKKYTPLYIKTSCSVDAKSPPMVPTEHPQSELRNKSITPASRRSSYSCARKDGRSNRDVETVAEEG